MDGEDEGAGDEGAGDEGAGDEGSDGVETPSNEDGRAQGWAQGRAHGWGDDAKVLIIRGMEMG